MGRCPGSIAGKIALNNRAETGASNEPGNSYPDYCWSYDNFGNRTAQMSANVDFPSGQGGPNTCSRTGSLGQNSWAQSNGTLTERTITK